MSSGERKYLAAAMSLSLLLATLIFVPMIAFVGISEFGEGLFGGGELLSSANTTVWSATYSMGYAVVFIPIVIIGALLVIAIVYFLGKYGKAEAERLSKLPVLLTLRVVKVDVNSRVVTYSATTSG